MECGTLSYSRSGAGLELPEDFPEDGKELRFGFAQVLGKRGGGKPCALGELFYAYFLGGFVIAVVAGELEYFKLLRGHQFFRRLEVKEAGGAEDAQGPDILGLQVALAL